MGQTNCTLFAPFVCLAMAFHFLAGPIHPFFHHMATPSLLLKGVQVTLERCPVHHLIFGLFSLFGVFARARPGRPPLQRDDDGLGHEEPLAWRVPPRPAQPLSQTAGTRRRLKGADPPMWSWFCLHASVCLVGIKLWFFRDLQMSQFVPVKHDLNSHELGRLTHQLWQGLNLKGRRSGGPAWFSNPHRKPRKSKLRKILGPGSPLKHRSGTLNRIDLGIFGSPKMDFVVCFGSLDSFNR